ncbi:MULTISPECIES: hypothetical protein [Pseudomonas]|uniref:Uncharacterized protein n=1 Tax=Pseudomonas juntendi TaxID=2666183 RepID=A0ABZ2J857_9PSED|nr:MULTISPECIES: hypothetical protein [Pseudomonas]EIU1412755.1 hypothetical protein [Pseudomonas aeruginosa]EKT4450955.1 hypothetical protein [Pseudomonas putida]MBC9053100.1 hypothetical protein [Pseudomonas aeruginosa]MBW6313774.1 hypothetical protein [Pseudomonas aeruginosa]MCA4075675.1 hypothetical protein [Pseudomonas kurunegalensis]
MISEMMAGNSAEADVLNRDRAPVDNHIYGAFGRDFETADGQRLMVAAITASQWRSLVACCDLELQIVQFEAQHRLDFSDEIQRYEGRNAIVGLQEPWFRSRSLTVLQSGSISSKCHGASIRV